MVCQSQTIDGVKGRMDDIQQNGGQRDERNCGLLGEELN